MPVAAGICGLPSGSECHSLELLQMIQVMRQPFREVQGFYEEAATAGRYLLWKVS